MISESRKSPEWLGFLRFDALRGNEMAAFSWSIKRELTDLDPSVSSLLLYRFCFKWFYGLPLFVFPLLWATDTPIGRANAGRSSSVDLPPREKRGNGSSWWKNRLIWTWPLSASLLSVRRTSAPSWNAISGSPRRVSSRKRPSPILRRSKTLGDHGKGHYPFTMDRL